MNTKPDIIVCLCDQLRPFELGCHGGTGALSTPNIDRLADGGVRFEHAVSNCPLCAPARSCLLSGQYSRSCTGKLGNIGDIESGRRRLRDCTMPELLHNEGYETMLIGKWHVSPHPRELGFDNSVRADVWHRNQNQTYYTHDDKSFCVNGFAPAFESEQISAFLRSSHRNPFFLYYNISLPHMPLSDLPSQYLNAFSAADVQLRSNVEIDGVLPDDRHWLLSYWYDHRYYVHHDPACTALPDGFDTRAVTAAYWGAIKCVDDLVGHLLDELERTGRKKNTLVLFLSDHGDNLGSHHLWNKERLNEESIRIPMIWHWPAALPPAVCRQQVAGLIDVAPTITSLAGIPTQRHFQGRDLSSILHGKVNSLPENYAISEAMRGEIGVRTPRWKYGIQTDGRANRQGHDVINDELLFYDLENDPLEMKNLIGTGLYPEVASELKKTAMNFHRDTPWLDIEPDDDNSELLAHD